MILAIHRGSKQIGGSGVELRSDRGTRILLDVGMPLTQPDGHDALRQMGEEGECPFADEVPVGFREHPER